LYVRDAGPIVGPLVEPPGHTSLKLALNVAMKSQGTHQTAIARPPAARVLDAVLLDVSAC
jgi:hypothetical protein